MRLPPYASFALLAACSTNGPASTSQVEAGAPLGARCSLSSDCAGEALCGFPIADGCNAEGVCVPEDIRCTNQGPVVCGCDGEPVGLACIYGDGYAPAPVPGTTPGCVPGDGGAIGDGSHGDGNTGDDAGAGDGGGPD